MSVLIRDMEMPRTHPITVEIYPNGTVISKTVGRMDIHGTAVPVPPHGRLIDADALEDNVTTYYAIPALANAMDFEPDLVLRLREIDSAPTVIEAEEGE